MTNNDIAAQLCQQYTDGKRNFSNAQLENLNLVRASLAQIDLSNSQLSYANLEQANLSNANLSNSSLIKVNLSRANLNGVDLSNADLRGANITGASIIGANFAGANLAKTNLSLVRLVNRKLSSDAQRIDLLDVTQSSVVSFNSANLAGTFFMGVDITKASLVGAIYNHKTKFGSNFNPADFGMVYQDETKTFSLEELLTRFNYLLDRSNSYLGSTITVKYFNSSRPEFDWLKGVQLDRQQNISLLDKKLNSLNMEQLEQFQKWIDAFTKSCSQIIKDFPEPNIDDVDDSGFALF